MNNKKNDKFPSNKLKEKIQHLRKELENNQSINSITSKSSNTITTTEPTSVKENSYLMIIEDLEQEIDLLLKNNLLLREEKLLALANSENLKKRINEEIYDIKRYRAAEIAEKLLPVLDSFERALHVINIAPEVKNFLTGFEIIYSMFKNIFKEEYIEEMETKIGEQFNSNLHSAIEIVETTNIASGCIVKVLQKGYVIHDRILRCASVQVAK